MMIEIVMASTVILARDMHDAGEKADGIWYISDLLNGAMEKNTKDGVKYFVKQ